MDGTGSHELFTGESRSSHDKAEEKAGTLRDLPSNKFLQSDHNRAFEFGAAGQSQVRH